MTEWKHGLEITSHEITDFVFVGESEKSFNLALKDMENFPL